MEDLQPEIWNAIEDNSLVWVDQETLDTTYSFARKGDLYHGLWILRVIPP